jgi:hypothetical protein
MQIVNLTPHPITILRQLGTRSIRVDYPACSPDRLPRATEQPTPPVLGVFPELPGDDSQRAHDILSQLGETGLVDYIGYFGVEGLPPVGADQIGTCYIVSVVTVIGAVAAGRPIIDLLIPMGQVRGADGRIIGATALAPAESLLRPMAASLLASRFGRQ